MSRAGLALRWGLDHDALSQTGERGERYLLVTNDRRLSPRRMFELYHDKVEKRFQVCKGELKVSPIYLYKDERITAKLLIHILALLAYSLLERQVCRNGLQMTTRRIIEMPESLEVIESVCWDGSRLHRAAPVNEEQVHLLEVLAQVLAELRCPCWPRLQLPAGERIPLPLSPPGGQEGSV